MFIRLISSPVNVTLPVPVTEGLMEPLFNKIPGTLAAPVPVRVISPPLDSIVPLTIAMPSLFDPVPWLVPFISIKPLPELTEARRILTPSLLLLLIPEPAMPVIEIAPASVVTIAP